MLVDVLKEGDGGVEEFLERLVVLVLLHLLLVELPEPLDEIQVGSVGREEDEEDVQFLGSLLRAMVVLGIVEQYHERNVPVWILLPQLFQECLRHEGVAVVFREEHGGPQGEWIECSEDRETLAAAVARNMNGVLPSTQLPLPSILAVVGGMRGISEEEDDLSGPCALREALDRRDPCLLDFHRWMSSGDQLGFLAGSREFFLA